jgi:2-polyprenyl-3-methyl-5-hydroxy-6-metoxy-1,4-benzoquinol methylase
MSTGPLSRWSWTFGCGTGRFSETLAAELGSRVIGLDPSEK